MSMEMCSRVEEMQISKYHMKGCKNEHNVDPVETGAIKKQSFNNFLTLFVMLCFTLFSILGIHLIKPQCHLASLSTNVATLRFAFDNSANLKLVHIGPKIVHIGHVLVQTNPKMG